MWKDSSNTKISEFNDILARQKQILRLQISMQNLPVVDMLDWEADLSEPVQNLFFREVV